MRAFTTAAVFSALAASLASAAAVDNNDDARAQHVHHQHEEKRAVDYAYVYVTVTMNSDGTAVSPTLLSETAAATSASATGGNIKNQAAASIGGGSSSSSAPASSSSAAASSYSAAASSSSAPASSSSGSATAASSSGSASGSATASSSASSSSSSSSSDDDDTGSTSGGGFTDGTIDCSDFPSSVPNILSLDNLGLGGWTSIQSTSDYNSGSSCQDGYYCSYACAPGYLKSQWPSQPSNGVSVGGLLCKNGKLYRTNQDETDLCIAGAGGVSIDNQIGDSVAFCRTDYPGSESMVIPTVAQGGGSETLAVDDIGSYFKWKNVAGTSLQYYVQDAGVSADDGCVWGSDGSGKGNWSPLIVGAGKSNGQIYVSITQNPNNGDAPSYNMKVESDGGSVNGECKYEGGSFSGGGNGCTATVTSGNAKIVIYN